MTDDTHDQVNKLFENQAKLDTELSKVKVRIQDAVQPSDWRVRVERLISTTQEVLARAVT